MSEVTLAEFDVELLPERQTLSLTVVNVWVSQNAVTVARVSHAGFVGIYQSAGNAIILG